MRSELWNELPKLSLNFVIAKITVQSTNIRKFVSALRGRKCLKSREVKYMKNCSENKGNQKGKKESIVHSFIPHLRYGKLPITPNKKTE